MAIAIPDDWRAGTQLRLEKSLLFTQLKSKCEPDPSGPHILALIDDAVNYCTQRTKLVVRHLKEYTLHDEDHLFRVLTLMERLIPKETLDELSVPELMLLILSAFFHDVGMAPDENQVRDWLRFWDDELVENVRSAEEEAFGLFVKARPERLNEISDLKMRGFSSNATLLQEYLIAEYIRSTHAERAMAIIKEDWSDKIVYRDANLSAELAAICFSHADNPVALLELDAALICGPDIFVCLPFIGVILRMADILDFDAKRTPKVLFSHIGVRNPVSLLEWKKHRQIKSWQITPKRIAFSAQCEHPAIEAAIHRFCDVIDKELTACSSVLQNITDPSREPFPAFYRISFPASVDRKRIQTKKDISGNLIYRYRDCQFRLNHSQVIDLLMGTSLYGDPAVAIRELVQNSIDACLVRKALEAKWGNFYEPHISIEFVKQPDGELLKVVDNGIGMDQDVIDKYYSTVGSSYYKSAEFYTLQARNRLTFQPISRFGIGILSCFMVASSIQVNTRRLLGAHSSSEPLEIRIEGLDSLFWILNGHMDQPGTETELSLRSNHPWSDMDDTARIGAIRSLFPNPPFPIVIQGVNRQEIQTGEGFRLEVERDWVKSKHVRQMNISLVYPECGICGQAAIGILEKHSLPTLQKILFVKNVTIEGEDDSIELKTILGTKMNEIYRSSDSLEISDDVVSKGNGSSTEVKSEAEFAVHGISMPMSLFPNYWDNLTQKSKLAFPFPIKLKIDVIGNRDLNLNTARNLVVFDEKWCDFADSLSRLICKEVRAKVSSSYWQELVNVWSTVSHGNRDAEIFVTNLSKV